MDALWGHLSHHLSAITVGLALAISCSILSVFIVLRKMAMIAESIAHAGIGGIAIALLLGYYISFFNNPYIVQAVTGIFCLATALLIGFVTRGRHVSEDSAIAIFLVATMALGILLIEVRIKLPPVKGQPTPAALDNILFGNITAVQPNEIWIPLSAVAIVIFLVMALYNEFVYTTLDEEMARINGVRTGLINVLLLSMVSLVIVVGVRFVGALMITALTVLPAATAKMLSTKFNGVLLMSLIIGVGGMGFAIVLAVTPPLYIFDPGPILVLTLFLLFAIIWTVRRFIKPKLADAHEGTADTLAGHDHMHAPTPTLSQRITMNTTHRLWFAGVLLAIVTSAAMLAPAHAQPAAAPATAPAADDIVYEDADANSSATITQVKPNSDTSLTTLQNVRRIRVKQGVLVIEWGGTATTLLPMQYVAGMTVNKRIATTQPK